MSVEPLYVITWKYVDGSGSGLIAVSRSKTAMLNTISLLELHGDPMKKFELVDLLCDLGEADPF